MKQIVSQPMRDAARDEPCTFEIPGACNGRTDTTVLCHLPDHSGGMGRKSDDISAAFGCSGCHDVIDGRVPYRFAQGDRYFYERRAQTRTWRRLIELGIITIKGVKT